MVHFTKSICPTTGFEIISHSDWTEVSFGDNYKVTFKVIENCILFAKSVGNVTINNLKNTLALSQTIIDKFFKDKPFVYMEDLKDVASITTEGRKYYINFLKKQKKLKALIYFNASPFLRLSINLAQKINYFTFNIYATKTYEQAINNALRLIGTNKPLHGEVLSSENKKKQVWNYKINNYPVQFEIIENNILKISGKGHFDIQHVKPAIQYLTEIVKEHFVSKKIKYYLLYDFHNITLSKESRGAYAKQIQAVFEKYPFEYWLYYGGNRLIDIIVAFAQPLIKFKIKKVKNLQHAIQFANRNIAINSYKRLSRKKSETQKYIDEFISFLSQIDWEKEGVDERFNKDISHPFYKIYDAVKLIKADLDELYLERKKSEEEKAILQQQLRKSLKLETMGKLAGSVAHDLNNVLSGIVSYPDIILQHLSDTKENEIPIKYIKRMQKSGQKAAEIVEDLLTLSRRGTVTFNIENLNTIITEYCNSPEYQNLLTTYPNISIITKLSDKLPNIEGSKIHLTKTIMNLVTNAVEAIKEKGTVTITTKQTSLTNKTMQNYKQPVSGNFILLSVKDTGSGISAKDLPKIFEPFYSKKAMGSSGTGLGMMVIKGTVDDHSGYIEVKSKVGNGTEFKLYFPVCNAPKKETVLQKIDKYTGKGEKILVVDDDEDMRIIAKEILEKLYYSVTTCSSGEEAVKYLQHNKVDLVILDMIMAPGIGGLETYKQILRKNPGQKAIIVSGYSVNKEVIEVQKLGAGKYIRKPYTMFALGTAVYEELNK
jgi:signal transduction histidine kinase/CheY-like chemotaxis protein